MSDDLVSDLRLNADWSHLDVCLYREAASRIEKLETALRVALPVLKATAPDGLAVIVVRQALEGKDD
jgi:hypothetical protein